MSSAISQLACFSAVVSSRRSLLQTRSYPCSAKLYPLKRELEIERWMLRCNYFQAKPVVNVVNNEGHGTNLSHSENKTYNPRYLEDSLASPDGNSVKSRPSVEGFVTMNGHTQEQVVSQPKRAAKIHDFCFGIPFGGLVLGGGVVGFIFSRSPATLGSGVLFGGALLALSTLSLKVWRQGKSSFPFILGQAALSTALMSKNFQAYSLTKKLFPTGFNVLISAAMLCFYAYVVLSGGNPPPKKLKHSVS